MPKGKIEQIQHIQEGESNGKRYYKYYLIVDQDEVTYWTQEKVDLEIGQEVTYYYSDEWNQGKMNPIKPKP